MERIKALRENAKQRGNPVLRDKSFQLLLETVSKLNPKSILEVGVNVGLSGVAMLLCAKDARLTGIEIDEDCIRQAKANYLEFGVQDRAKIFFGDAGEIIPLLSGKFDFIFLDGPKGHYFEYAKNLLPLLNINGVLFADNVLFRGYVDGKVKTPHRYNTTKNSMQNFLKLICEDQSLDTKIYDMEDGVSITQKLK